MTKKIFCLYFFLISTINLFGQIEQTVSYKNQLKISPFKIISDNRGLQLSYERQYCKNLSSQITLAYLVDILKGSNVATWKDYNGYLMAIEQKFLLKNSENGQLYFSTEISHFNCLFTDIAAFEYEFPKDSIQPVYLDTFNVHKNVYTFNLKGGIQLSLKQFIIDFNFGLGIRSRNVIHSERLNYNDKMEFPRHPNIEYSQTVEGKYLTLNIPLDLKIGYKF